MATFSGVSMVLGIKCQVTVICNSRCLPMLNSELVNFAVELHSIQNGHEISHSRYPGIWQNLFAERSPQMNYNDDYNTDPFLLSLIKQSLWIARSLFVFLIQQPSELKYIEWPSFQSTLQTAALTLSLIALLIVALSYVDSAWSSGSFSDEKGLV